MPSPSVCTAALNAARRVNDFPTAVRIFEGMFYPVPLCTESGRMVAALTTDIRNPQPTGIKSKVENKEQYQQYLKELEPLRKELGVELKEDLYPQTTEEH